MNVDFRWIINFFGAALNCDFPILEAFYYHFPVESGNTIWPLISAQNYQEFCDQLKVSLNKKRWKVIESNGHNRLFGVDPFNDNRRIMIYVCSCITTYDYAIREQVGHEAWTVILEHDWSQARVCWNSHVKANDMGLGQFVWPVESSSIHNLWIHIQELSNFLNGYLDYCYSPDGIWLLKRNGTITERWAAFYK